MSDDAPNPQTVLALPAGSSNEVPETQPHASTTGVPQAGERPRHDPTAANGADAAESPSQPPTVGVAVTGADGGALDGDTRHGCAEGGAQNATPQGAAQGQTRPNGDRQESASAGPLAAESIAQEPPAQKAPGASAAARGQSRAAPSPTKRPSRAASAAVKGRAFVVTSGKGGVGKTTVTANVGAALADAGKRVVVVDADVGLRNLDVVMGLENRVRRHSLDVLDGVCTLEEALVRDRGRKSLMLLPAAQNRDKDEIDQDDMVDLVEELRDMFDLVLIDCPAGIERGFRNAVAGAQEAIIVTTPEVSAVRDADRVAGLLPSDMPARLIINRVRPHLVRKGTMMSVDDVLDILRLDLLGVVPDDREVIVATNRGNFVIDVPGSPTGQALRDVAARLLGEDVPLRDPSKKPHWLTALKTSLTLSRPSRPKG